jgi:hypothetical protein
MTSVRFVAAWLLLILSACSAASDFKQPITQLSKATAGAEIALTKFNEYASAEVTAQRREEAIRNPGRVLAGDLDCSIDSPRCIVALTPASGVGEPLPLTVSSLIPNHVRAMREIGLYAKGLEDIVNADATAAVKAGLDKAGAAVAEVAALAGPQYRAAASVFAVPVTKAAAWLFGEYQEAIKLDALRDATAQMESILPGAVKEFGIAADLVHNVRKTYLVETFNAKQRAFDRQASPANLKDYLDAAQQVDDALQVKPSDVFTELGVAHHELATALRSDDISFATVMLHLDRLVTKAEQLTAIAQAFETAVNTPEPAHN